MEGFDIGQGGYEILDFFGMGEGFYVGKRGYEILQIALVG